MFLFSQIRFGPAISTKDTKLKIIKITSKKIKVINKYYQDKDVKQYHKNQT